MLLAGVQLRTELGAFAANLSRAESLLKSFDTSAHKHSLLVFPELSFSGYNFVDRDAISPHLESREGPSIHWAREMANTLKTHIVVGFAEKDKNGHIYNTAALVSPSKVLAYYRKTHLYDQDKRWGCSSSPEGFQCFGPFKSFPYRLQIGICMDLNPWEFTAPFNAFEFASSCRDNMAQIAAIPMAWTASPSYDNGGTIDKDTVDYWDIRQPYQIPTVFANKWGEERGVCYAGSSSIRNGKTIESLGIHEDGIVSAELSI